MLQRSIDQPYVLKDLPVPPAPKPSQPTVDLRELVRILRRRWQEAAAAPAALVALALIYGATTTTLYTATSTVLVHPRRATAIESNQSSVQTSNFGTDDATIESETMLIQSVAIMQRVVDKLKLTDDPEVPWRPG